MKKKIHKIMSMLLCSAMIMGLLPTIAFADEGPDPEPKYVAWIEDTGYETLEDAVNAAESDDTITLGEGEYTLYEKRADTLNKNLTFVGAGPDKTIWYIGAEVPDPDNFGTEYNGDYSFDGAGTVTFEDMTLQSGEVDYLGFIRADNTIVDGCTINGKTFYWGYTSATFKDTIFNAPEGDYAIWTYCSPIMTFDGCTFNVSGKAINVYRESGSYDVEVNYKDCAVESSKDGKAVMNINDSLMGDCKFTINISGDNAVEGITPDDLNKEYSKNQEDISCSRLFEFNTKYGAGNSGRTIVNIDDITVWENGEMVDHKYSDGHKDNAFDETVGDWQTDADGKTFRTVEKICQYCGYTETSREYCYTVTFDANGGKWDDDSDELKVSVIEGETVTEPETPERSGYNFEGWFDENDNEWDFDNAVMGNLVLVAKWDKESSGGGGGGGTKYYTLSYDSNGGTKYDNERYRKGTVVKLDKEPKREGYEFTGWYADEDLENKITEVKMTMDKTVYAGWEKTKTEPEKEEAGNNIPDLLNGGEHFAYVAGYPDGHVKPERNITRAETAAIFYRLLKPEVQVKYATTNHSFPDVPNHEWYVTPVATLSSMGIICGRDDGTFDPNAPITRAEFAAICARFDESKVSEKVTFTDIDGHWAEKEIERAAALGWASGYPDGSFLPEKKISRAEAMTIINRVLCRLPETAADLLPGMKVWPDNLPGDWYYLAVQEATNGHKYEYKDGTYERWTELTDVFGNNQ